MTNEEVSQDDNTKSEATAGQTPSTPERGGLSPVQSIHTLEGDLFAAMKDDNYGSNIVRIAANARPDVGEVSEKAQTFTAIKKITTKRYLKYALIIAMALILIGVGVVMYLASIQDTKVGDGEQVPASTTPVVASTTVVSNGPLIEPEAFQELRIASMNKGTIVREINGLKARLHDSKIVPETNVGVTLDVTVRTFFEKIRYSGSDSLLRSFSGDYAFGLFADKAGTFEPYILVKINSYDLAFAGILEWEPFMPGDLKDIFAKEKPLAVATSSATSTATSVVTTASSTRVEKRFTDQILKNIDTRTYVDSKESLTLVYGFINKEYLLITGGADSFIDIRNKLLAKNILR